ncbi:cobalt-precorrin-6A reductase [Streptomyces cocklensis]|jgi:precorrin-6A/cobalt-precorrin-6A reductase|nr:cobalt-precorrin-6A reductase [Actinacidiphila cocklensis]MDD1059691.1 cobalt-precorrin-6A reductase [Actinacidiphila cocklensis]
MRRVVILGGTAEARVLAELVAAEPGVEVTTSLAGRTPEPRLPAGQVRIGGFGGPEGLAGWLREQRADAVVDATHPFAEAISRHAALAADAAGVPLLALRRPGWSPGEGDRWHWADTLAAAAALLPALGHRPFLTVGRQDLAAFAGLPLSCLARSIAPPPPPLPAHCRVLLDRGPFTLDAERALLRRHGIDVLVTKDSGGPATAAKLTAAREAALPVLIVRRPPPPPGVPAVASPAAAAQWLRTR